MFSMNVDKKYKMSMVMVSVFVIYIVSLQVYNPNKKKELSIPKPISNVKESPKSFGLDNMKTTVAIRQGDAEGRNQRLPRLPKALIIGFNKCGTAALRSFLSIHPDIVSPTAEVRFFTDHYARGLDWYRRQMPLSTSTQITIEKTPGYIRTSICLRRIYAFDPNIKLLVIVRNPVTRLQSMYAHKISKHPSGVVPVTFTDWVRRGPLKESIKHASNYTSYFLKAFKIFPKNQFMILSEEELEKDPLAVIKKSEKFLGLRRVVTNEVLVYNKTKGFYCLNKTHTFYQSVLDNAELDIETGCMDNRKGREHPTIEDHLLQDIIDASKHYVYKLFDLIHTKFEWKYY